MLRWYVIQTKPNREKKTLNELRDALKKQISRGTVAELVLPTERVSEVKGDQRVDVERLKLPTYLLIKADLPFVFTAIKRNANVVGFVGNGGEEPVPLTEDEAARMLDRGNASKSGGRRGPAFSSGDEVRIVSGPLADFPATVVEADEAKRTLTVTVTIFGRETRAQVDFGDVRAER